jgi:hypothetical protein
MAFRRGAIRNATSRVEGARPTGTPARRRRAARPGSARVREAREPPGHEDAVLARERHHVGDGRERRDLRERGEPAAAGRRVDPDARTGVDEEGLGELPGDAGAAQLLEGVLAAGQLRVHEHRALRQRGRRQMVVRDDDVDAAARGLGDRLDGRDPAVDGDDALGLVLLERAPERRRPQAVSVVEAVRDERPRVGAELAERRREDREGADPVAVVVAEDDDAAAAGAPSPRAARRPPEGRPSRRGRGVRRARA